MEAQQARLELPAVCCWTGRVAAWAPFPSFKQQQQQANGLAQLKTAARGLWLRSEQGGVLMVRCSGDGAPPLLTFTLRTSQRLVHAPLNPGSFAFQLLCPMHGALPPTAGGCSGHLLFLATAAGPSGAASGRPGLGQQAGRLYAVHFDTMQGGLECGALLQAIQGGSLELSVPSALPAAALLAAAEAAGQGASVQAGRPAAAAGGRQVGAEEQHGDAGLFGYEDDASLTEAMKVRNLLGLAGPEEGGPSLGWLALARMHLCLARVGHGPMGASACRREQGTPLRLPLVYNCRLPKPTQVLRPLSACGSRQWRVSRLCCPESLH